MVDTLPVELLLLIVGLCDVPARTQLKLVSRQFYVLSAECQRHRTCLILPNASSAPFRRRQHVQVMAGGEPSLWARMSEADDLRSATWRFSCVLQPRVPEFSLAPPGFFNAIPATLHTLELHADRCFGLFMLRSLCASLMPAWALQRLVLVNFAAAEFAHVVNALAARATSPFNHALRVLDVRISDAASCLWPDQIDVAGLLHLTHLDVRVELHAGALEKSGVRSIVDHTLELARAPMTFFAYHGAPLSSPAGWTSMVLRSAATLTSLVMPQFPPTAPSTEAEMAVDAVAGLEQLHVHWQSARLDFMLRNKTQLRTLHHYGGVRDSVQLLGQLAGLVAMAEFFVACDLGMRFATLLFQSAVHWPACTALHLGGLSPEETGALQAKLAAPPVVDPMI